MDFELTEEQRAILEMAKDYGRGVCAPTAAARDREERFPEDELRKAGELGLMGLLVPEEFGGSGAGNVPLSLALMEINRFDASVGVTLSVHNSLVCGCIAHWGSDELKQTYLPRLATGEWLGAYALTESEAGSDAGNLRCKAVRDGDDFVIHGSKFWITSADHAQVMVLFTRTDPDAGSHGITAFVIETDWPGVQVGKQEPKMGIRSSSTNEVVFDGLRVPAANVLGEVNKGFSVALHTLDGGRIGIACQATGIMQACLDASLAYARERKQFGRAIAEFQPIQWKLAEMERRIHASRLLTLRAAWLKDRGERLTREAAVAKLTASTGANWCARQAVQVHGGAGYCTDFPVERFFRDARITEIYEGTTEIQRLVIARSLLRE